MQTVTATVPANLQLRMSKKRRAVQRAATKVEVELSLHPNTGSETLTPSFPSWNQPDHLKTTSSSVSLPRQKKYRATSFKERKGVLTSFKTAFLQVSTSAQANEPKTEQL